MPHSPLFTCLAWQDLNLSGWIVMVTKNLKLELIQKTMHFFESLCSQTTDVPGDFLVGGRTDFVCVLDNTLIHSAPRARLLADLHWFHSLLG